MGTKSFAALMAGGLAVGLGGCTGQITTTAAEIYDQDGPTSFNRLAQRATPGPGSATIQDGDAPSGSAPFQHDLLVVTESRCHPGDLDNGMTDFWKMVEMMGNGDAVDGLAYTFTLEAADGSLLGTVTLGPDTLINEAQKKAVHKINKVKTPFPVVVPGHLRQAGSFYLNLFACVDADKDGSCADEDVKPPSDKPLPGLPGSFEMPGMDKPFGSRLVASLALKATVQGTAVAFEPVKTEGDGQKGPGNWLDASGFTSGLLNNLPSGPGEGEATPSLKLKLAVRSGDYKCTFSPRDLGCFVAGTRIRVPGQIVRPVEQLPAGAHVETADGRTALTLRAVAGPEAEPVITFRTRRGHVLTVSSKHPMLTRAGLKLAEEVTPADRLVAAEGPRHVRIASITRTPYSGVVFNFALPGDGPLDHLVVAEGLVVGDLVLQEQLGRRSR